MPRICTEKNREYQKKWYSSNREKQIKRNAEIRDTKITWLKEYKKKLKCSQCEENHPACLEFHHTNPSNKIDGVSQMVMRNKSLENIKLEIAKCIVLCSNCHRKLHYEEEL
jgi:hypothetical protein